MRGECGLNLNLTLFSSDITQWYDQNIEYKMALDSNKNYDQKKLTDQ